MRWKERTVMMKMPSIRSNNFNRNVNSSSTCICNISWSLLKKGREL